MMWGWVRGGERVGVMGLGIGDGLVSGFSSAWWISVFYFVYLLYMQF